MLYRILTGDRFLTIVFILIIGIGIWIPFFIGSEITLNRQYGTGMPFFQYTNTLLSGRLFLSRLLSAVLVFIEAMLLVRINGKYVLIQKRTYLPALFFVLIVSSNKELLEWNPVLPAAVFVIIVLDILLGSHKNSPDSYRFFDTGIILGLGSLFYAPLVFIIAIIWISKIVQRPQFWREYLFPILGFIVPYVFLFAILFFRNEHFPTFFNNLSQNILFGIEFPEFHLTYWIFIAFLAFLVALSSIYFLGVFKFRKIYLRDYFLVLFWLFIITVIIYLFLSGTNPGIGYLMGIPLSFILSNYFINSKKSLPNKLLLFGFVMYILFLSYSSLFELSGK